MEFNKGGKNYNNNYAWLKISNINEILFYKEKWNVKFAFYFLKSRYSHKVNYHILIRGILHKFYYDTYLYKN